MRTSVRTYVHTYLHTYFFGTHFPMQYLYTESLSHSSFTFLWLLNGRIWLLRWPAAAVACLRLSCHCLILLCFGSSCTYTRTHPHAHIAHACRWPHNAHIHTCTRIHTHFHARFYHAHTHRFSALLHTFLSRTSLRHTFVAHADPSPSLFSFLHFPTKIFTFLLLLLGRS